jgi:hypothetical protein
MLRFNIGRNSKKEKSHLGNLSHQASISISIGKRKFLFASKYCIRVLSISDSPLALVNDEGNRR